MLSGSECASFHRLVADVLTVEVTCREPKSEGLRPKVSGGRNRSNADTQLAERRETFRLINQSNNKDVYICYCDSLFFGMSCSVSVIVMNKY